MVKIYSDNYWLFQSFERSDSFLLEAVWITSLFWSDFIFLLINQRIKMLIIIRKNMLIVSKIITNQMVQQLITLSTLKKISDYFKNIVFIDVSFGPLLIDSIAEMK